MNGSTITRPQPDGIPRVDMASVAGGFRVIDGAPPPLEARRIRMDFDGFLYIFAVIGIAITAVAASLGVALTVTMARLAYARFKLVAPLLFPPVDIIGQQRIAQQRGATLDDPVHEPASKYAEKMRMPAATNGGRNGQAIKEMDVTVTQ